MPDPRARSPHLRFVRRSTAAGAASRDSQHPCTIGCDAPWHCHGHRSASHRRRGARWCPRPPPRCVRAMGNSSRTGSSHHGSSSPSRTAAVFLSPTSLDTRGGGVRRRRRRRLSFVYSMRCGCWRGEKEARRATQREAVCGELECVRCAGIWGHKLHLFGASERESPAQRVNPTHTSQPPTRAAVPRRLAGRLKMTRPIITNNYAWSTARIGLAERRAQLSSCDPLSAAGHQRGRMVRRQS